MAARYSAPSAAQGVNRFRVWPAGTDQFEHALLVTNWDNLDGIIGIGPVGDWPPSRGVNGGIYAEVSLLKQERAPIGSFMWWFRPSVTVPLTTVTNYGWALANGQTLAPSAHSFPGIATSVTLPNVYNAMILGADPTIAVGTAGAAVGSGSENTAAGAPGIGGIGGLNSVAVTIAQMATHDHGGVTSIVGFNNQANKLYDGNGPVSNCMFGLGGSALDGEQGNHAHVISAQGGGQAHENRARYVGLLPLIKVLYVSTP